jgi:chaperonin cofactor prefoldin
MTDVDRLQFHFPKEVQARIEDLDRRIEGARAEEEDHQRALSRLQIDLAQSMALRKAVFDTAEAFLRNAPSTD